MADSGRVSADPNPKSKLKTRNHPEHRFGDSLNPKPNPVDPRKLIGSLKPETHHDIATHTHTQKQ
jgi:hypothetical protein